MKNSTEGGNPPALARWAGAAAVILAASLTGCDRDEIKVYRVAKETTAPMETSMPAGHPEVSGALPPAPAKPQWTLPANWQEIAPSTMRVASFAVTGSAGQTAEVGIIPLPTTGEEIALVNMWREQMRLPEIAVTDAGAKGSPIVVGAGTGELFEMASEVPLIGGTNRARILVAMTTRAGMSWFFKMTGEDLFVAGQKASFTEFLKSISFPEASAAPAAVASAPTVEPANPNPGLPQWTAPADWKSQPPGQMVLASYAIAGDAADKATVNISAFPGDVGGLLANVNRWRRQVGLGEIAEADLEKTMSVVETAGGRAQLVDLSGANARVVGAIVPHAGQTWFYKMTGSEKIVSQQKEAFIKFVQTVKY